MSKTLQYKGIKELKLKYRLMGQNMKGFAENFLANVALPITRNFITDRFHNQSDGFRRWEPLALETIDDRISKGFPGSIPILRRTGELLQEALGLGGYKTVKITSDTRSSTLSYTPQTKKAWAHISGIGKPGQRLPQRNFLNITKSEKSIIKNKLHSSVLLFLQKGK